MDDNLPNGAVAEEVMPRGDDLLIPEEEPEPLADPMDDSILDSVKHFIGAEPEDRHFDRDIRFQINTWLLRVNQIGIGPRDGFRIIDHTQTWRDLLGERVDLLAVQDYLYIKARLHFDPPTNAFLVTMLEKQADELIWCLRTQAEHPVNSFTGVGQP